MIAREGRLRMASAHPVGQHRRGLVASRVGLPRVSVDVQRVVFNRKIAIYFIPDSDLNNVQRFINVYDGPSDLHPQRPLIPV